MATCEVMGGFIENNKCIFRELYIVNAGFECEKSPLFGKRTERLMSNEESLSTLGIRHVHDAVNYPLCEVPLGNILNIHWRRRDLMENRASYRVQARIYWREFWANASEEEKEQNRISVREAQNRLYARMTPDEKKKYLAEQKEIQKERYASMSPEEKKIYLADMRERNEERRSSMSPEEKKQYLTYLKNWRESRTEEEIEEDLATHKARWTQFYNSLTPEEKEGYLAEKRKHRKKWYDSMSPEEKKLRHMISYAKVKFPPEQHGGCFMATRWMQKKIPEMKEHSFQIGNMTHCIGVLPDGRIVDTQIYQMGFIRELPAGIAKRSIFTKEEYKKIFPESNL